MLIGYARISKHDQQNLSLQLDALVAAGVKKEKIFIDKTSGIQENRPGLDNCLKSLRPGDKLVIWKIDRLGRSLRHLINTIYKLHSENIDVKVLSGVASAMDTATAHGKMVFSIVASVAEYERELIRDRTNAGLSAARARGRVGGRPAKITTRKLRIIMDAMKDRNTIVKDLAADLGISPKLIYRYISPEGELREHGKKLLDSENKKKKK